MITILVAKQTLIMPSHGLSFDISTAALGEGQSENSWKTPTGKHEVSDVIGGQAPIYTVFKSRKAIGIAPPDTWPELQSEDMILSRIIRLKGTEPGFNSGPGVDTYERYIYIHGTHQEHLIGTKCSKGCIRMRNTDIITLCQYPIQGMPVTITES